MLEALEFTSKSAVLTWFRRKTLIPVGQTVYLGNSRVDAGSKGNIYLRAYRKDLELKTRELKHQPGRKY